MLLPKWSHVWFCTSYEDIVEVVCMIHAYCTDFFLHYCTCICIQCASKNTFIVNPKKLLLCSHVMLHCYYIGCSWFRVKKYSIYFRLIKRKLDKGGRGGGSRNQFAYCHKLALNPCLYEINFLRWLQIFMRI